VGGRRWLAIGQVEEEAAVKDERGGPRRLGARQPIAHGLLVSSLVLVPAVAAQRFDDMPMADAPEVDQEPTGALRGQVAAEAGAAVPGATVEFRPRAGGAARVVETDSAGRFLLGFLPGGDGDLRVEKPGFRASQGPLAIPPGGVNLKIELEVDPGPLVAAWLEQGRADLAAGRTEAARAQFERALTILPDDASGEVVRALARTYFVEGRIDEAALALEGGLVNAPGDGVSRKLLVALLDSAGRRSEGEAWLAALDRDGQRVAVSRLPERPRLDLAQRPTGRFRAVISEAGPLSDAASLTSRLGAGLGSSDPWSPARESFEIYVPDQAHRPAAGYGAVVWISPNPLGVIPDRGLLETLDRRGLIWIGANDSGNQRPTSDRVRLALAAAGALQRAYPVDARRLWAAGYSGGGRVASALIFKFAEVFAGGIFYMGANFYEPVPDRRKPLASWSPAFEPPPAAVRLRLERASRLVLVTAEFDFNRFETRAIFTALKKRGFRHASYLEIPGVGHFHGVHAQPLSEALARLDQDTDPRGHGSP
jgi:dienelactone hydrolase